ncbi:GNAT family N-acetyltransferase [Streptomyces macrosporus]
MRHLSRPARRALLVVHVTVSAAWLGLTLALLTLAVAGAAGDSPDAAETAYRAMATITDRLVAPVALLTLTSGLALSLGTSWGPARHRWVFTKFWLTLAANGASILLLRPGIDAAAAEAAAGRPVNPVDPLVPRPSRRRPTRSSPRSRCSSPGGRHAGAGGRAPRDARGRERGRERGRKRGRGRRSGPARGRKPVAVPPTRRPSWASVTSSSPSSPTAPTAPTAPTSPFSPSPLPPAPPVRRLTLADLPACLDLAADRGWSREEHKWRLLLTAGQGYGIDAPADDVRGGLIGAFVLTTYGPPDGVPGGRPCVCVSMVLVARRHARRGLGLRLMRHALREAGDATVFLFATDLGRPLYERLGFTPLTPVDTYTGRFACACPGGHTADVPVRDATAADLPAVRALDTAVFGADRTHLLARLPSFADRLAVAASGTETTGFAAAWPNGDTTVIGPVVAEDETTARALIAHLASRTEGPIRFDTHAHHRDLAVWLRAHGLAGGFLSTLMVHGAPDVPCDTRRVFAPCSVALG